MTARRRPPQSSDHAVRRIGGAGPDVSRRYGELAPAGSYTGMNGRTGPSGSGALGAIGVSETANSGSSETIRAAIESDTSPQVRRNQQGVSPSGAV